MSKKISNLKNNLKKKIVKATTTSSPNNGKRKVSGRKVVKFIILVFFICCICGFFLLSLFLGFVVIKSPNFDPQKLYSSQPSVLYDKDGNEFARVGSEIRDIISYDQLPESLVDALVATEDSRFFQHNGFDLPRFMVATSKQLLGNSSAGGASTLTMQLSKNFYTSTNSSGAKGIIRKFTDIYMAVFKIEKSYTKQEIIEFYVNSNYLGADVNGVEDAAKVYFNKSAKDMNIAESAMIAGLFNAPGLYDPYKNPEGCEQRRETVLYLMKRHGYINDDEYEIAKSLTVDKIVKPVKTTTASNAYQGFINTVVDEIYKKTGDDPYETPMKIYTTMDRSQQEHMDKLMNGELEGYKWQNDKVQGGIAVINAENGSISAIGAGRNRGAKSYNYATDINAQIGSTAKPLYDYSIGVEYKDWNTGTIFVDEPWGYSDGGVVKNWDLKYRGFTTIRQALVDSVNICAIKAFQSVENSLRVEWTKNLGLHPEIQDGLIHEAHALGGYNGESPLSMAAAYNTFANKGYYIEPYSFKKIEYINGDKTFEYKYTMKKVMSEETAYIMTNMLISVAQGTGFNNYYVNGVTYAGKSGTTNLDEATIKAWSLPSKAVADIWAVGYTNKFTIAAWYGYDSMSSEYYNTFGNQQNYRLFTAAAKGVFTEQSDFVKPDGVIAVETEVGCYNACLPSEYTPNDKRKTEFFKKGSEPTTISDRYDKLKDVTNLNAKTNGSNVELSWTGISTPHAIDLNYLKSYYEAVYENDDWGDGAATGTYNENLATLGTIVYKIYEQSDGGLKLVKTTSDTKATVTASSSNPTYIIKTSYTNFAANMSQGASIIAKGASSSTSTINVSFTNTFDGHSINNNTMTVSKGTKLTITKNILSFNSNTIKNNAVVTIDGATEKEIICNQNSTIEIKISYNGSEKVLKLNIKVQ